MVTFWIQTSRRSCRFPRAGRAALAQTLRNFDRVSRAIPVDNLLGTGEYLPPPLRLGTRCAGLQG
jgi:hypothetical protein